MQQASALARTHTLASNFSRAAWIPKSYQPTVEFVFTTNGEQFTPHALEDEALEL